MDWIYILPVLFSGVAGILCILPSLKFEEDISVAGSVLALASSIYVATLPDHVDAFMHVDGLSKVFLIMISAIYVGVTIFSVNYLEHIENKLFQTNFYFFLLNLFVLTMLFTVIVDNIGLMWVGVEATTLTSALLIATENEEAAIEATWRYIIIVSAGLVVSLIATIFIYAGTGTLSLSKLLTAHPASQIVAVGAMLAVVGYGTKAGIFPMHTWLPDAHGRAPAPVSAIFSAVLLPVALFSIVRIIGAAPILGVQDFAFWLGFLSVAVASLMTFSQRQYKRLFAYSSIENMGIALIGISVGGYGFVGAIVIIVAHAFAKSATFLLSGNVLAVYKTPFISEVKGVYKKIPLTGYLFSIGALAVTGAPPFGSFLGELLILTQVLKSFGIVWTVVLSTFIVIAFLGVNYRVARMVFSEGPSESESYGDATPVKSPVAVAAINLALALLTTFALPVIYRML